ncbi:uncharacterized protein RCO7_05299 [Rhynchosporium graminicola]|uniref:Heterokaryon incompatibility domain-containing protein n=1 Tax=Rhynchosporium graminicola TaxID=2792576 RepID=A0A1E1LRZ5_9HELO|nr:uncharacterized protein RCO7_05299 [Rhynchosporium commune]
MGRLLSFDSVFKRSRRPQSSQTCASEKNTTPELIELPVGEALPVPLDVASSSCESTLPDLVPLYSSSQNLCAQCLSFDIPALFRRKIVNRSTTGDLVAKLNMSASELILSTCSLCQLFGSACVPCDARIHHELRAIPADRAFIKLDMGIAFDCIVLSVWVDASSDSFSSSSPDTLGNSNHFLGLAVASDPGQVLEPCFGVQILDRVYFNVAITKHWLEFCRSNHFDDCHPTALVGLSSFRVIDCSTRTITNVPQDCQYIALSYVWGQGQPTDQNDNTGDPSIQSAPKVITDSIEVATLLGFRYIWVDRYCINQSDAEEKHNQIKRMDLIYASAQLTIIAVAGDNPSVGLPGVNGTLRNFQPSCQVGKHRLVSSLITASDSLHGTAWNGRAWTYQEGLLSKRRLIFSADQVYFECNGMNCAEVVHLPLETILDQKTGKAKAEFPAGAFVEKAIKSVGHSTEDNEYALRMMEYVSRFTQRKLSYESDALNAIQGIFRVFEKLQYPTYQLMGIPIEPLSDFSILGWRSPELEFMVGLMWHHKYIQPGTSHRRPDFPSWSWAGWEGCAESYLESHAGPATPNLWSKVSIELKDRSLLPFPQDYTLLSPFIHQVQDTRFIHITAKTAPCEIVRSDRNYDSEVDRTPYLALIVGELQAICLAFLPGDILHGKDFSKTPLEEMKFTAIIYAPVTKGSVSYDWRVSVLMVEEKGDFAERVGICLPRQPDTRIMNTKHDVIPNCFDTSASVPAYHPSRHGHQRVSMDERHANRMTFKKWIAELPTRTIRLG